MLPLTRKKLLNSTKKVAAFSSPAQKHFPENEKFNEEDIFFFLPLACLHLMPLKKYCIVRHEAERGGIFSPWPISDILSNGIESLFLLLFNSRLHKEHFSSPPVPLDSKLWCLIVRRRMFKKALWMWLLRMKARALRTSLHCHGGASTPGLI